MHGLLSATLTQVFTRTGGTDVSLRDVTIAQMGNGATECWWRHAPEARGGFWGFGKSQLVSWVPGSEEDGWLSGLAEARRICALRAPHEMGGGRWKSQNRKNVYLSPYVEDPLNSKVIKSFVLEIRSRKCFSFFEIPCSMYTCYDQSVNVSHIRIWLWYSITKNSIKH